MCQSKAEGGQRCVPTITTRALNKLRKRTDPESQRAVAQLVDARSVYGPIVSPLDLPIPSEVSSLLSTLEEIGDPLLVGGTVRDALMEGTVPKDFDIEVHGVDMDSLARKLRRKGYQVDEVGRQFGVLKTRAGSEDIDISVPRKDSLTGSGHRGFTVDIDEEMGVKEAASRRDFTINAMMYSQKHGVCIDPYNGREDLDNGVLRHVSDAFGEDPLRPLRAFQFAGRYNLSLAPETAQICRDLRPRAEEIPTERVRGEWRKFYTKATDPQKSLAALKEMGWDDTLPGTDTINGEHVQQAVTDAQFSGLNGDDRTVLVASVCASNMSNEDSREFMRRTIEGDNIAKRAHLLSQTQPPAQVTRAEMRQWSRGLGQKSLTINDWQAREKARGADTSIVMGAALEHGVADSSPVDHIQGRHLLETFPDRRPGPWVGQAVVAARQAEDEGLFTDEESGKAWLKNNIA
jgi:tRNA nucleotidyltransferase/poly(A) polymerase